MRLTGLFGKEGKATRPESLIYLETERTDAKLRRAQMGFLKASGARLVGADLASAAALS